MGECLSALDVMERLVDQHICETGGKNRSAMIDAINREMGLPMGSPYCAATVSHCFREVARLGSESSGCVDFPYTGSSQALRRAFATRGLMYRDPRALRSFRGALGGWTDGDDPAHGHIFFVKGRLTSSAGEVVGLITLEANTSPQTQERDGEGMFELHRTIASLRARHPDFWFLRTDGIRGGEWWD
jgi:hypothetical protein